MEDAPLTGADPLGDPVDEQIRDVVPAWQAHLETLGLTQLKVTPAAGSQGRPPVVAPARRAVKIATEGALWGSIRYHGLLDHTVIVSDDAGQVRIGQHALCWVHAERLVHQLIPFNHRQRLAVALVRQLIWWFYADLKAYQRDPCRQRAAQLRARFERIFRRRTGFVTLDRLLARLHARKAELLRVLARPEIPLHTDGSENDIRCHVTKRKVSGGTWSEAGRDAPDACLGLLKTCQKQGLTFFDYLGARLGVPHAPLIPPLPDLVPRPRLNLTARPLAPVPVEEVVAITADGGRPLFSRGFAPLTGR